ncbi:MAG: type II secretion system F family protein [Caulobacteraceae bacterium]|nr:type II secretion system F family protein [Caulobacteraceae bacterium]
MATYRYRAVTPSGVVRSGDLEGQSQAQVISQLRLQGLRPIETQPLAGPRAEAKARLSGRTRQAVINAVGELAVLLEAGLPLNRALAICAANIDHAPAKAAFAKVYGRVKEGATLSSALAEARGLFPPVASAMCEAGEADGRLGAALTRLAETLDRAEALRQTVISSLVYPCMLVAVATGVILVMLLVVVPQFEVLFDGATARLPFATRAVMAASQGVRTYGLAGLGVAVAAALGVRHWLSRPATRLAFDRRILGAPLLGHLIANAECAAFARTLGSLVDGGVPLPTALGIAQRSVANRHMAAAVGKVAAGLKQGGGLSGPLAATGVFPAMAISFLRTGEETARLGLMLGRLADVLDRTVRATVQRLVSLLTPAITVFMGAVVATVIASIMSAILGFNDLALTP